MKLFGMIPVFCLAVFLTAVDTFAQRTPARRTTPRVVTSQAPAPAAQIKEGSEKVAIQIKNVSKFIYVLGGAAQGIEALDKDTRANQAARATNEKNKKEVLQAIRNLRAGLIALEVEFRTKATLKAHLVHIEGIANLSAQSEDLAMAGRYVESGKPLLIVVEKLSDTLAAM
jgi:hypothetical protein